MVQWFSDGCHYRRRHFLFAVFKLSGQQIPQRKKRNQKYDYKNPCEKEKNNLKNPDSEFSYKDHHIFEETIKPIKNYTLILSQSDDVFKMLLVF